MTMIAEPGVLSTSPWNSDGLFKDLPSDLIKSCFNTSDGFEFGFPSLDLDSNSVCSRDRSGRRGRRQDFSSSCSPSSTSSECSEEFSLDFICQSSDATTHISDHDYLSTTSNLLDDDSMTFCTEDFDWTTDNFVSAVDNFLSSDSLFNESCECEEEEVPEVPSSSSSSSASSKAKRSVSIDPVTDNTSWSSMSTNEQLTAIEDLTNVISNQLGLREQLDIIRIIEPTARVTPTDTEFVIDLNILNDQKLCRVRDYVRKVQSNQRHQKQGNSNKRNSNNSHHRNETTWKSGCSSNGLSTSKSEGTKGKSSRVQKELKERRTPQKVLKQRQNKEHRQLLKERRSGLFVREEVLSLSTQLMMIDEDSDIDILG